MRKPPSDLLIPLQVLEEGRKTFSFREPVSVFSVLSEMEKRGEGLFLSAVDIHITLCRVDEFYRGEGTASAQVRLECGRCLEAFVFPLTAQFVLTFSRHRGDKEPLSEEEEQELSEEDAGLIPFCGEELDLCEAIQEQLLMAMPVRPLCREECLGLCPVCGADRNREACHCSGKVVNPKWEALAGLKIDEKK